MKLPHATMWVNLESIMLRETRDKRANAVWFYLNEVPKVGKFTWTESRIEFTRSGGER